MKIIIDHSELQMYIERLNLHWDTLEPVAYLGAIARPSGLCAFATLKFSWVIPRITVKRRRKRK